MQLTCPVTASFGTSTGGGVIKLSCSLSRPKRTTRSKRTAHIARGHKASTAARIRTIKQKSARRSPSKRAARQVFLCRSV
jgi:hypothetical protein